MSIRTTWDLLLTKLNLETGSEILVSSITISNMIDIIKLHGLTPIPFDQNLSNMSIDYDDISKKITPKTKIVLIAHIFGAITPMSPLQKLKNKYPTLLVVEDYAQSFKTPRDWKDQEWVDVSMLSFGTIKTMSCLGGSLSFIRDSKLAKSLQTTYAYYPQFESSTLLKKIIKGLLLKFFSQKSIYSFSYQFCRVFGFNFDTIISRSIKGFSGENLLYLIRKQLPSSILSLMIKKINHPKTFIYDQQKNALFLLQHLKNPENVIGYQHTNHGYWLFAVKFNHPKLLIDAMHKVGIDATQNTSHMIRLTKSDILPLTHFIYLPIHQGLSPKMLLKMAQVLNYFETQGNKNS